MCFSVPEISACTWAKRPAIVGFVWVLDMVLASFLEGARPPTGGPHGASLQCGRACLPPSISTFRRRLRIRRDRRRNRHGRCRLLGSPRKCWGKRGLEAGNRDLVERHRGFEGGNRDFLG